MCDSGEVGALRRQLAVLECEARQLRATLRGIGDAVIATDAAGLIVQMNPVAEALTGWREADARGRPADEVFRTIDEKTRSAAQSPIQRMLREGAKVGRGNHTTLIARDGSEHPIAESGAPIRGDGGEVTGVVLVFRDQSAERRATAAVELAEARFRTFFDNAPIGKCMTAPDGKLLRVNRAFGAMLGYSIEQLQRVSFAAITHPEDLAESQQCVRCLLAGEQDTWEMDKRYLARDGHVVWTRVTTRLQRDDAGAPVHFLTHIQDITAARFGAEALARSRRELELRNRIAQVFLTTPDEEMYAGVLEVLLDAFDSPHGVFGYIDEDGALVVPTMTRRIWDQCEVADKTRVFPRSTWGDSIWPRAIRQREVLWSNERAALTPAGHIPVQRSIAAPIVHRGKVVGLLQVANKAADYDEHDLALARTVADTIAPILHARLRSEREQARRRAAEQQLRLKATALARSNEELEQFAYVAAHDLQEPLRMVSSFTQLLAQRYGEQLDQDARDFIGFAVDGANRMQRLIQDLLSYSRVTTRGQPPEALDAHDALGTAVANLQTAIQESGALVTNGELPIVLADRTQLAQVFQNLIANGLKFHRPGEPPRVHVSARPDGDGEPLWTFAVTDQGIGIDPRHFERLFVIFRRLHTRDEYPGTGVGLALCKRIVERHGGKIWLESEPGQSTTFHFTLPGVEPGPGAQR